jgi:hypothetical protein
MKKGKIITYVIGIIAFALPIIIYFTPPTDSDGPTMLVYNFFFFYPLVFLSIIFSLIVIFRLRLFKNDLISIVLLVIAIIPVLILTTLIIINMLRISNEPPYDIDIELHNNTVELKINDTLNVNLHGFTNKKSIDNNEIVFIKTINVIPYINQKYSFKDGGNLISASDNYDVYYKVNNDSLFLYSIGVDFLFFNQERIPLPILTKEYDFHSDSICELENNGFRKFEWK